MNYKNKTLYFFENKILSVLSKRILQKNKKFKNLHQGESCYLVGNGASIKYYNLEEFDDKIAIGCNGLFFHSSFKKLNVQYYYTGHPFLYYPYWRNNYTNNVEKNVIGSLYKDKMLQNKKVFYFTSLSNYFGLKNNNIFYLHHFGKKFNGFINCNLDNNFTSMNNALSGMLGLALYMGFEDITFVGCDYLFYPQANGHFFDFGRSSDGAEEKPINEEFVLAALKHSDLRVVIPNDNYKGHILPHISYQQLTGKVPEYKENDEVVSSDDLMSLNLINTTYKIFPQKQ